MKIEASFASSGAILKRLGVLPGGRVQKFVDSEVLRLCEPYIPRQQGMLAAGGYAGTEIGSGTVVWNSPYARFLYYGKVMVGEKSRSAWAKRGEKKIVTDKELRYRGAPMRGKLWFERMKADHGKEIALGAGKLVGIR